MAYAAIGVNANVSDVRFNVSPFVMAFDDVSATENRKFPAVVESHTEMWEIVSDPADHDVQDGSVVVIAFDPVDAADHVSAFRVVSADTFDVPADPGSPVCSFTAVVAGAENAVAPSMSSHLFARFTACRPTVMPTPHPPRRALPAHRGLLLLRRR
jgi:hypothetical protein